MANNRDKDGRFLPGHKQNSDSNNGGNNKIAIGRPSKAKEAKYLRKLNQMITMPEWTAICRRALEDAKNGDDRARNWIGNYLMGKPNPVFDERFHQNLLPGAGAFDEPDFDQPRVRVMAVIDGIHDRLIVDGEAVVIEMRDD